MKLTFPLWIYLNLHFEGRYKNPIGLWSMVVMSNTHLSDIKNSVLIRLPLLQRFVHCLSHQSLRYNQNLWPPQLWGLILAPLPACPHLTLSNFDSLDLGNAEVGPALPPLKLILAAEDASVGRGQTMLVRGGNGIWRASAAQPLPPPSVYPFVNLEDIFQGRKATHSWYNLETTVKQMV